jgi:phenolic acid decarboxylase
MRTLKTVLISLLFAGFTSATFASEAFIGQFLYKYKGGNTYRVTVADSEHMKWECIEGSEKGAKGEETPQRFRVNNKVFYATWVEKTGINVSQVIDFKNMKVYSTIVDGKERYVLEGKVIREK